VAANHQKPGHPSSGVSGPRRNSSPVTWRSILIGLVLIPLNAWWLVQIEYVRYSDNATTSALFFHVVALLLLLLACNALIQRVAPGWTFSRSELLVIYVMVSAASVMAAHDQLQILISVLAVVVGRATPENQWSTQILPFLPSHLVVMDRSVIDPLFAGGSSLYADGHWRAWLRPLGWWGLFALALVWVMLCLTSLLRRQWDAEHLNYPIAEVPLAVTSDGFFRKRLLWVGMGVGAVPQLVNLVHMVFPAVPEIPVGGHYYPLPYPWGELGLLNIPVYSYPFLYGLAFLLPLQLMSSYIFFLLVSRLELIISVPLGYMDETRFPYIWQQGTGACFGLAVVILWAARGHLKMVWHDLWGRIRVASDGEAMSYRTAILGLVLGGLGLVAFCTYAGMRAPTACLYLSVFFVMVLTVARVRAELGLPTFELLLSGADQVLQRVGGTQAWNRNELGAMTLFFWLTRTNRQFPILTQVDALRVGRRARISLRNLSRAIMLASGVGIVAAFWALLHVTYQIGYDSALFNGPGVQYFGMEPVLKLMHDLQAPAQRDWGSIGAYVFGAGFAVFLGVMRARFVWWPFHPIGYLAASCLGVYRLWVPIFITWVIKGSLLRYGGLRSYQRVLPFFLGLVLGEFGAAFLRTIIDLAFNLYLPVSSGIGGL
jgi:hypothetical protein